MRFCKDVFPAFLVLEKTEAGSWRKIQRKENSDIVSVKNPLVVS